MTSVLYCQRLPQPFVKLLAIASIAALCGCQQSTAPTAATKGTAASNSPAASSAKGTSGKELPASGEVKGSPAQTPGNDLPGVETPVQAMPNPVGPKEPDADKGTPATTIAYEAPATDEAPASSAGDLSAPSLP